jgi:hypothetical protein
MRRSIPRRLGASSTGPLPLTSSGLECDVTELELDPEADVIVYCDGKVYKNSLAK